jgi:prepilin-type N-terminal cleavage/methylation domain-containing protein
MLLHNSTNKRAKHIIQGGSSKGFTLLEMLGVIIVLGIVAAIINAIIGGSAITEKGRAEQKYDAAMKLVNAWATTSQFLNVSKHPLDSNIFAAGPHDARDILIPNDPAPAIATPFVSKFISSAPIRALEQFQTITAPTASSTGVYAIGDAANLVTVGYTPATQSMSVTIQNVAAAEVRALIETYFPSSTGTSNYTTTARTTSNIQYTALSATDTHNVTFIRKL